MPLSSKISPHVEIIHSFNLSALVKYWVFGVFGVNVYGIDLVME